MKKENLIGKKFEKLTVISEAENIQSKKGGRSFTAWNCQCECGSIIIVRTGTLLGGQQKSCRCVVSEYGLALKVGQVFNKLTTVSYNEGYWRCKCECGEYATVLTHRLISGNTKSCGCLKSEKSKNNIKEAIKKQTKYHPSITTARRRWKSYLYQDKNCNLTFDEWFKISQQNCFYCGIVPTNKINCFLKKKDASKFARDNGNFTYNGLDRVDSSKYHTIDNVVACCSICNRAKSFRTLCEFNSYLKNMAIIDNKLKFDLLELPKSYLLVSLKIAYRYYIKNYEKMEIDLKTFYTYSQQPCFYCSLKSSNCYNVYLKDKKASQKAKNEAYFYYNGIDRMDNTKTHTIDNIVPCCRWCNFAKNDLSLLEFQDWINRVQQFQKDKNANIT